MLIREIKENDIGRCLDIYNYYVLNTDYSFEEAAVSFEDFKSRVDRISEKYPYIVAEIDGAVVGFAYVHEFAVRSAYRFSVELSLYVDKDNRGGGVGRALVEEISKRAKAAGLKEMISIITADNENSCRFHERMGFEFKGKLDGVGFKFGKWRGIVYYQKSL